MIVWVLWACPDQTVARSLRVHVYAPGDDGHILVHTILKYEVDPGGKIRWTLVDAKRD